MKRYPEQVFGIIFLLTCLLMATGCAGTLQTVDKVAASATQPSVPVQEVISVAGPVATTINPTLGAIVDILTGAIPVLAGAWLALRKANGNTQKFASATTLLAQASGVTSQVMSQLHPDVQTHLQTSVPQPVNPVPIAPAVTVIPKA